MSVFKIQNRINVPTLRMLFLILLLNLPHPTLACECTEPMKLKAAIKESTQIFMGTVLGLSNDSGDPSFSWVSFKVRKSWKGATQKQTRIKVASAKACGYPFSKGKEYLVFSANRFPYTSACGWTKPSAEAENTVMILGRPRIRH